MDEKIELLLTSYSLLELLEENDIEEKFVLTWLVENSMIKLKDYF